MISELFGAIWVTTHLVNVHQKRYLWWMRTVFNVSSNLYLILSLGVELCLNSLLIVVDIFFFIMFRNFLDWITVYCFVSSFRLPLWNLLKPVSTAKNRHNQVFQCISGTLTKPCLSQESIMFIWEQINCVELNTALFFGMKNKHPWQFWTGHVCSPAPTVTWF